LSLQRLAGAVRVDACLLDGLLVRILRASRLRGSRARHRHGADGQKRGDEEGPAAAAHRAAG
jgi:hypothetical protein